MEIRTWDENDDDLKYEWRVDYYATNPVAAKEEAERIAQSWRGGPSMRSVKISGLDPI